MTQFPEDELEQTSANLEERENIQEQTTATKTLSSDDIHDLLDRFDGFEELLAPLADNLKSFSPGKDSKKRRFLQDEDLIEERQEMLDRVSAYLNFLQEDNIENHKQVRTIAQKKLDKNEELINENLDTILEASRDLEQTYRELDTFFRNAEPRKVKNLTLLNVHPEALLDADSNSVYNAVEKLLMNEALSVDQRKAYSMLVIPGLWKSKRPKDLIERYAKLAGEARMSFLTDFEDCENPEDAQDVWESKKWQGVTGPEAFYSKLILFANHILLRGQHDGTKKDKDMKGSVAMAVAGKMYKEKISQPIMGEMNGSLSGSQGLAFKTNSEEVTDLGKLGLNSTMHAYDKDMVYNKCTAFDGDLC